MRLGDPRGRTMQALGQLQRPCALANLHPAARCQLNARVQSPWRAAGNGAASLNSCVPSLHCGLTGTRVCAASSVTCFCCQKYFTQAPIKLGGG